jgi:hypothetical protein
MQGRRLRRPRHSTIVAYAALFAAIGGTSYAAATIGSDDIQRNAVRSKHVENRSLVRNDFKRGQVPRGRRGRVGARGPQGVRGPQGLRGAKGNTGATGSIKGYANIDPAALGTSPSGLLPRSKGVLSVWQPEIVGADNRFCFQFAGFEPTVAVASPTGGAGFVSVDVLPDTPTNDCPATFRAVKVETFDIAGGPSETLKFKVIFE